MLTFVEKVKNLIINFTKIFDLLVEKYLSLPELTKVFLNILIIYIVALGLTEIAKKLLIGLPKMVAFIIFIILIIYLAVTFWLG